VEGPTNGHGSQFTENGIINQWLIAALILYPVKEAALEIYFKNFWTELSFCRRGVG
jgi:hypothetical protein